MLLPFASHGSGVGDGISLTLAQSNWLPTFQDVLTWGSNGTVNPNFLMDPSASMNSHITMPTEPMFYDGFQNMDPSSVYGGQPCYCMPHSGCPVCSVSSH